MISMPGHRILVIDDESTHRILAREYLEAAGYIVRLAEDGARGLSMAKRNCPDLVLVDLMIPGIDGLEICRTLKANPGTAHVPIILITASREPDVIARGLEAGADDFVTKPVDWQFIHDRVAYVLAKAKERRRLLSEARSKLPARRTIGGDAAAAAASASPSQPPVSSQSAEAATPPDSEAIRQSVELEHQAQIQELRDQLASAETAAAEQIEEMRVAHAAALVEAARQSSESGATSADAEIARLSDEMEALKRSAAAEIAAAMREAAQASEDMARRYESEIDSLRTDSARSIETLTARFDEERSGLLADLMTAEQSIEEMKHELRFADVLCVEAANSDDAQSRVAACWDFIAACTSVYSAQVRSLGESIEPALNALVSTGDDAVEKSVCDTALCVDTLLESLNTMRMLAQIMAGKSRLQETEIDLRSLLDTAVSRMAAFAEQSRVSLHCELPDMPVRVVADEPRLTFATLSVLMNAIRFSPHGASVAAWLEEADDGSVCITIRDEGVGIEPARLERLQSCLDRASWNVGERHVGLGIPLAMAIARAHSGELQIDSTFGGGTQVRLQLPRERVSTEAEMESCALSA